MVCAEPYDRLPAHGTRGVGSSRRDTLRALLRPRSMAYAFRRRDDALPGRLKLFHPYGAVACVALRPLPSRYTGLLHSGAPGLVRLGWATDEKLAIQGIGLKLFVDGGATHNCVAVPGFSGQDSDDFFARGVTTWPEAPTEPLIRALAALLQVVTPTPTVLSVASLATVERDGRAVAEPRAPRRLRFTPTGELSTAGRDVREALAALPVGAVLYRVEDDDGPIAELVTRSPFVASSFGDRQLHFAHQEPRADALGVLTVRGRLVHASADEAPLHHMAVRLRCGRRILAAAETDLDGRFALNVARVQLGRRPALVVDVLEPGEGAAARRVAELRGPRRLLELPRRLDLGDLRVRYWEYDASTPLPRAATVDGRAVQPFEPGYMRHMVAANLGNATRRAAGVALLRLRSKTTTVARVQALYPEPFTRGDAARPRSDAWFAARLLDGFNPVQPERREDRDDRFMLRFRWPERACDQLYALPDVDVALELRGAALMPAAITIAAAGERCVVEPGDPRWERAKRVARMAWNLDGELRAHLARCHLNMEQYAVALWRNLRRSPLRRLLAPHLRSVVAVNRMGDASIFGNLGVMAEGTPLHSSGAVWLLRAELGRLDWRGFRPPEAIYPGHRYARCAQRIWGALADYVRRWFSRERAGLAASWGELRRFSEDLVEHAVEAGAVSPAVLGDAINDEELGRLEQLATYVIFHATFAHSWTNDLQVEDGSDLAYANLAMRGATPSSLLSVDDEDAGPWPYHGLEQLYFAYALSAPRRGLVVANDYGDLEPELVRAIAALGPELAADGFDVARLRSRINI